MKTIAVFCVLLATTIAGPVKDLDLKPEIEGRIAGGLPAAFHQFRYQVALVLGYRGTIRGGALISSRVVLTAAHCLYNYTIAKVHLGAQSLLHPHKYTVIQRVTDVYFTIHPEFDPVFRVNDIGLIFLPIEVVFNEYIQPIGLPRPDQAQCVIEGKAAVVTGWGLIGDNKTASVDNLLYANVRILPGAPCQEAYPDTFRRTQICVSGDDHKSVCIGDSGGPLVVSDAKGIRVLVGVISGGKDEGCELGYPTISTRVTSYLDWIAHNAGVVPK